jgi:hypothetical protein
MPYDSLLADMQRATYTAWAVTGISGIAGGFALELIFRTAARLTRMRVLAATITIVIGILAFAGLQMLRYRIEEAPFEPPVWIHPGFVSLYLPAASIVLGVALAAKRTRQVAAL